MSVHTEYTRYAAKLARKLHADAAMGGAPAPDADFYKSLAKSLDEVADALEAISKRAD